MKKSLFLIFLAACMLENRDAATSAQNLLFSLTTTSTWREFKQPIIQHALRKSLPPKDKWVLVGEIKLKSKETLHLQTLTARWQGSNLKNTTASLYAKKLTDRRLPIPIEENLICDGAWNPKAKEFIFPINKKLVASDTYYLMLNVPTKYETLLRKGAFEIIQHKKRALLNLKNSK